MRKPLLLLFFCLFLWGCGGAAGNETAVPPTAPLATEPVNPFPPQEWTKIEPGGDSRCAHNTPYAFWVRPGITNHLLLYFEGGGGCWSAETCAPGSSLYDDSVDAGDDPASRGGILDFDNPQNPFQAYTAVYIPVCTGDVHWGNHVQTYIASDGSEQVIYHRGFVNSQAALQWAYTYVPQPDSLFMTGCSAGSVGSIAHAPYVIQHYPDTPLTQLGDSLAFVFHRPLDLQVDYHVHDNFAPWIPALAEIPVGDFLMSRYYSAVANHYPNDTFAQYNTQADIVQEQFYVAVGGEVANFPADLAASLDQIHTQSDNFRSYTASGTLHCITPRPQFYTLETAGVRLRDWVAALAAGQPVETVQCETCGVQTETADSPRPVTFETADAVTLQGMLYGEGETAVIFSTMGEHRQNTWAEMAQQVAEQGVMALTYDFRFWQEDGSIQGDLRDKAAEDLLAAIVYARTQGAQQIILVGASLGGMASIEVADETEITAVAILAAPLNETFFPTLHTTPEDIQAMSVPLLLIASEDEEFADDIQQMYELAAEPKTLHLYPGSAHGTDLFNTAHAADLQTRLLAFIQAYTP